MPIEMINESAVTGRVGCDVPIRVLADDGTSARVITEGTGIHLKQGEVHTVRSSDVKPIR